MKPIYKRKHGTFELMGSNIKTDMDSIFYTAYSGVKKDTKKDAELVFNEWRFSLPKRNIEEAKNK